MINEPQTFMPLASGYKSIQTLRAVAALLVALMHIIFFYADSIKHIGGAEPYMTTFYYFKGFGGCGIQIFFVISGFIMAYLNAKGESKSFSDFALRRLTRVVPLYWLCTLIWAYILLAPGTFPLSQVLESLFFIPRPDNTAVLGVGWSLNFEMFFYLVFGLCVFVFNASFLWAAIVFLIFNALGRATDFYVFNLYSDPIVWNFIAGIAIFHLHGLPWVRREAPAIFWAGLLLLLSSIFWHIPNDSKGIMQFLPWGVPSMMIVLGAVGMEVEGKSSRLFGSKIMLELGNSSYALYLVHTMCFIGVSTLLLYTFKIQRFLGPDGAVLTYLVVCCVIGWVVHHTIEKPMTRLLRVAISRVSGLWLANRQMRQARGADSPAD